MLLTCKASLSINVVVGSSKNITVVSILDLALTCPSGIRLCRAGTIVPNVFLQALTLSDVT